MANRQSGQPRQPKPGSKARTDKLAAYSRERQQLPAAGKRKFTELQDRVFARLEVQKRLRVASRKKAK